ncbi:hypothetical protein [Paraburkholderia kirstenboschensis]|uniref:Uncharacterized protein n=1 Tax=Paraburkholderia kirstenboschensis TaxID=1245436 RepID=A0ABZ0EFD0_9BURK|nr:hypothetical protein [Paraburkholderia kirstenboschensis]WOD15897.1 hypothetical protein RW095_21955 [Paraburkholderia kirstenboschensis]
MNFDSTHDAQGKSEDTSSPMPDHPSPCINAHKTQRKFRIAFVLVAILAVLVPTTVFALVVYQTRQDAALGLTTIFSFMMYSLVSCRIRASAKQAFKHARRDGHLPFLTGKTVRVARECPRRWLVVLHIGFEGFSSLD